MRSGLDEGESVTDNPSSVFFFLPIDRDLKESVPEWRMGKLSYWLQC